jgi:hypothetical protein
MILYPTAIDEHCVGRGDVGDQLLATSPEPARDRLDRRLAHRDLALFRSLSPHGDRARSAVEVGRRQATQLGDAEPAAVQQLEHGVVTQTDRVIVSFDRWRGFVEEHLQLVAPEHAGQARLALRCMETGRGVDREAARAHEPREVTAQRRSAPSDCARRIAARRQVGEVTAQCRALDARGTVEPGAFGPLDERPEVAGIGLTRRGSDGGERLLERLELPRHEGTVPATRLGEPVMRAATTRHCG